MSLDERLRRIEAKLDELLGEKSRSGSVEDARYLATLPVAEAKRIQREKMRRAHA